jgi:hypothetical protein
MDKTVQLNFFFMNTIYVVTLALSLQPRQGVARLWAKRETQESLHMLLGMNPHTPKWIPMLGVGIPNGFSNL